MGSEMCIRDSTGNNGNTGGTGSGKIQCHYCKKYGHKKFQCYKNPKRKNYRGNSSSNNNNNTNQNTDRNQNFNGTEDKAMAFISKVLLSRQMSLPNRETKWYLDSGATAHMCNSVESFSEL